MPLIDLDENSEMFDDISSHCKPKDDSYEERWDKEWQLLVKQWQYAKTDLDCSIDMERMAREKLIKASLSNSSKGFGVKVQKIMRKGSVKFSEIPALQGIDLDQYRKPASESWRITLDGD